MSRIADLIAELCPKGVPTSNLLDPAVATFATGTQLNRSTLKADGAYQVFNGGVEASGRHPEFNTPGPAIIVSQGGASAGYVNFVAEPFWAGAHCYVVTPGNSMDRRYLYHVLKSSEGMIQGSVRGAGIPGLSRGALGATLVPVPPQEVQCEIARILDQFTELEAELEAELAARQAQYAHYRDFLVTPTDPSCQRLTLREIALDFGRGKSRHRPRNDPSLYGGTYPFIQTGDVRNSGHRIDQYSQTYNEEGLVQSKIWPRGTICITIAANIAETGVLDFEACFPDSVIGLVVDPSRASPGYVEYLLQSLRDQLVALGQGSAQANINLSTFENLRLPFPKLEEQERMVSILDDFEALLNDPYSGLPAAIAARRRQYEYYRERLLMFEEAVA